MARILKPGGRLALLTSPPEFEPHIARFSKRMASSMRLDTLETLDGWMQAVGLVPEEMKAVRNAGNLVIARKDSAA